MPKKTGQKCRFGSQNFLVTYTDGQAITNQKCKQFFNGIIFAKNWPKLLLNDNNINGYTIPKSVFGGHNKFLSRVQTDSGHWTNLIKKFHFSFQLK